VNTQSIRNMITQGMQHEENTGALANILKQVASMYGQQPSDQQLLDTVHFIRTYVEHVPALLEHMAAVATQENLTGDVEPMLAAIEQYFVQSIDIIPDHAGLVGLMDDAYLAHCLMQAMSDRYQRRMDSTLLPLNMTAANQAIRVLIGEPHATALDASVRNVLQGPAVQNALQQLMMFSMRMPTNVPDPIWGNASIDEIVNARMGALGIV
jgi:uncharacterized membrane protein YkvA (DUF1232 family)